MKNSADINRVKRVLQAALPAVVLPVAAALLNTLVIITHFAGLFNLTLWQFFALCLSGSLALLAAALTIIREYRLSLTASQHRQRADPHSGALALPERGELDEQIDSFFEGSGRYLKNAMLIIDLDGFESVNDGFGRETGDAVLRRVASNLRELFRTDDLIGRTGGDEFTVLIKNATSGSLARLKAEEICEAVRHIPVGTSSSAHLTCSVGISIYDRPSLSAEDCRAAALEALREAKSAGGNCCRSAER